MSATEVKGKRTSKVADDGANEPVVGGASPPNAGNAADGQREQQAERPGGVPDVRALSKEEILALLEQRRAEFNQVAKVAKEKGVKVPGKKATRADGERLLEFFNRVGYQTGMRQWATGRRAEVLARIKPVVDALGEGFDQEMRGDAVEAIVAGFREARIQTSFKSSSMPNKKEADDVPATVVLRELVPLLRGVDPVIDGLLASEE